MQRTAEYLIILSRWYLSMGWRTLKPIVCFQNYISFGYIPLISLFLHFFWGFLCYLSCLQLVFVNIYWLHFCEAVWVLSLFNFPSTHWTQTCNLVIAMFHLFTKQRNTIYFVLNLYSPCSLSTRMYLMWMSLLLEK